MSGYKPEYITLIVEGQPYTGWESLVCTWDAHNAFVTFQVTTTEIGGLKSPNGNWGVWNFPPGTECQIFAGNDKLVSGVIQIYAPQLNPDQHTITVVGVTFARLPTTASIDHPTGTFENRTDYEIVSELAGMLAVPVKWLAGHDMIPFWQIRQGATHYAEMMRLLQQRAKLLTGNMDGGITVLDGTQLEDSLTGTLVEGKNLISMSARLSDERFDVYKVKGENFDDKISQAPNRPFGIAYDITAHPITKVILDQGISTTELAQRRANWERARAYGASTSVTVVTPSWRDATGLFWQPYTNYYVNAPSMKIDCWLWTQKIIWSQDLKNGTIATITLIDPAGISGTPASCNSDPIWSPPWLFKKLFESIF